MNPSCVPDKYTAVVEPVLFEEIDAEMIYKIAKDMSGSGGPSKMDADGWSHILCSKNYGKAGVNLCQSIADLTKRLCTEDVNSDYISEVVACRLIPLIKDETKVRPIGVGEVLRRIMAKAVARVLKQDIISAAGSLQTCSGVDSGIEAVIHAMAKTFEDSSSEAMLLVDADNAFNNLNRKTALLNIKELCPPLYTFLNNTYKAPSRLIINNSSEVLLSQEGTTQGDPDAMDMYSIATRPLVDSLAKCCDQEQVKQGWYADDSTATGTLAGVKTWFEILCERGPSFGYFPNSSKSVLIVKNEECEERAREMFKDFPSLKIRRKGIAT